jgi:hypothetical protein
MQLSRLRTFFYQLQSESVLVVQGNPPYSSCAKPTRIEDLDKSDAFVQCVLIAIKYSELLARFIEKHAGGLENRPRVKKLKGMMVRASQGIYKMPHLQTSVFTQVSNAILE